MPDLTEHVIEAGIPIMRGTLRDGRTVDVTPLTFGAGQVAVGPAGKPWYERTWRYADLGIAVCAAAIWNGEGRPVGWVKDYEMDERQSEEDALAEWLATETHMPRMHELKAWPETFEPQALGLKSAEFRLNDRDFGVRDYLWLREWVPSIAYRSTLAATREGVGDVPEPEGRYTGRELVLRVTHATFGPTFGIPERYVMLSTAVAGDGVLADWINRG